MANRAENARVTASVTIGGVVLALGTFEDRTGGASDSSSTVINRGGMGAREALGGRPEPANVTIKRVYDTAAQGYEKTLRSHVGHTPMTVSEQPLDDEGQNVGPPTTWTGKLKMVNVSDRSSEGNAAEMLELEMVVETIS